VERAFIEVQTTKLLNAGLVELFRDEYVSTTMMPTKNDIFGN
jgi:hypothetical protein